MSHAESSLFLIWEAQDQMDSNYIKNTLELIQNFIISRIGCMINDWNSLPPHTVNASDITIFKTLLDEHWLNLRFDCCQSFLEPLIIIGASLSEPHHVRSTMKSVFLLACLIPYHIWLKTCLNANQHYIKYKEC